MGKLTFVILKSLKLTFETSPRPPAHALKRAPYKQLTISKRSKVMLLTEAIEPSLPNEPSDAPWLPASAKQVGISHGDSALYVGERSALTFAVHVRGVNVGGARRDGHAVVILSRVIVGQDRSLASHSKGVSLPISESAYESP